MPALIPEILLYNLVRGMIKHVATDFATHQGDPENSFLGRVLMGIKDHKHDYFVEAKALFVERGDDNPRGIKTRLFFDANEAAIPTVHITMPQETTGQNSLGAGESGLNVYEDDTHKEFTPGRERRFDTNYHIIITSDNHREVLIMYHVIRAMMVSALSEVDIAGLENPKLGGQDIRPNENIVPRNIFMRGITLQCSYEVHVPRFFSSEQITTLIINPGQPIDPSADIDGEVTV